MSNDIHQASEQTRPATAPESPQHDGDRATYDVAIIGYGPVGVTAANLLGQRGLRVLVVERDASVYSRARAISTDEEVLRIWQRIGLAERLKADMLHDRPIDFVDDRGRSFLSFTAPSRGNGHPAQLFIYQPALEAVLREGVERFTNIEVLLEHECVRFAQDRDGVDLTLVDLARDQLRRVRASYVIAADGGSSPTRGQLGISFEGRTYEDRWVVIDTLVKKEWPEVDRLRFHCDPARPTVDCPTPLGHHRWEFPVLEGDDEAHLVSHEHIWQLLQRQNIGPEHVEILRAVVYSHHVRFAARWRVGRIFLAGDAAHVMPPWIGQGMASGVRDADNLCWKLAGVLSGELPAEVLDSYEAERKPHVRAVTANAVFAGRIITERRPAVAAARNVVLRALDHLHPLHSRLSNAKWAPPTTFTTGFLDRASASVPTSTGVVGRFGAIGRLQRGPRADRVVGHLLPQPFVIDPEGDRVRLDDVTGASWRLFTLDAADPRGSAEWFARGAHVLRVLPAGSAHEAGAVVDVDDVLVPWLSRRGSKVAVVRPDGVIYAASGDSASYPACPLRSRDHHSAEASNGDSDSAWSVPTESGSLTT